MIDTEGMFPEFEMILAIDKALNSRKEASKNV